MWFFLVVLILGCNPVGEQITKYVISKNGIEVTASSRLAGAIESVTYNGVELLVAQDHGRGLQSASSFDFKGESYNPTEAGSSDDFDKLTSTSQLLAVKVDKSLETIVQMAYWLPVEKALSDHILSKRVEIIDLNTIRYDIRFYVPKYYSYGCFEILTGYMPPYFNKFYTSDGEILSPGPGEQPLPVFFSDGELAMGVFCEGVNKYGRHDYIATMKWNAVHRQEDVKSGFYDFRCYVFVGTFKDVKEKIWESTR